MKNPLINNAGLRREIAKSSPQQLWVKSYFWQAQKRFWFILGFTIVALALLAPYTYEYAKGFIFLTLAVQLLAVWGFYITIKSLMTVEVETAILYEIEERGASYLRDLKAGRIPRIDLERVEADMLPVNRSSPPPAMIRLFQHICKEARDRKFESSINIIQPYREEPMEDIFKLQNVQKIALWLGIMGTFVGLLLAIQEDKIGGLTRENKFAEIIQNMFDDLFISFSASLAGLEVAVIVGFLMLLLRKKHEVYFKLMESTAVTMLSVAHNATNHDDFMTEFQQVSGAVKNLSERVFDQTIELSSNLNNVQQQILSQNKQIEEGLLGLTKSGQEFGGFLTKISTDQQAFINDVRGVYDAVSLKNLGTTLQESIVQAGQHIAATINPNMSLITSQLAEFNKSIEVLRQAMSKQTADMEANVKRLERQIKEHADASKSISQQLKDSVSKAEAASPNVLRSDMNDLLREVKRLSVAVRDSYAAPRWTDWLRDKFYSFSRWRDS